MTSLAFAWKLVIFHEHLNLQSCHRSSRSLHSTMNYYGIFNQFPILKLCPWSLRKLSLPVLFAIVSWIILMNRCNSRTNAFTVARQLFSVFLTTFLPAVDNFVVCFCYYSIYRPLLTLSLVFGGTFLYTCNGLSVGNFSWFTVFVWR